MSISVDDSQLRHLTADLGRSKGAVGAKVAAAVRKTAYAIEGDAKALAPVDTGALRGSISTRVSGDGRFGSITAEIGPTVDYGVYQELGTSVMAAQPYMAPAFDRRIPGFEAAVAKAGSDIL